MMGDDLVIRAEGLSKKFCRSLRRSMYYGSLDVGKTMLGWPAHTEVLRPGEFWAVDDVSFELQRGASLGVMGVNGSGKSTLLRLLNGIYHPDRGRVEIRGRIGGLIALGAGFHPLLSGRENIYLNGAILGMGKKEIDKKFEQIVEFAEIGDALEAPIKTYSSGMNMRLGFAIAINSDPDILLIDEVLSVGDANFQKKCYQKLLDLKKDGTAITFVSHAVSSVERMCTQCLLMKQGRALFYGDTREAVQQYFNEISRDNLISENLLTASRPMTAGVGDVVFSEVRVYQENGDRDDPNIEFGKNIIIEFNYKFHRKFSNKNQLRVTIRTFEGRDIQKFIIQESQFIDGITYPNEKMMTFKQQDKVQIKIINPKLFPQTFRLDVAMQPLDIDIHVGGVANAYIFNILHPAKEKIYLEYGNLTVTEFDYLVTTD